MATLYQVACDTCPFTSTNKSQAQAARALRIHSCDRHLAIAARLERGAARRAAVDRTPKACHHKQANHQHGTYTAYTLDQCKCPPCAAANAAYEANRTRQQAYGRWDNLVDAQPARDHCRRLMAAGMGLKRIAACANVATGVLWRLLYGRPDQKGERVTSRRITKAVAARLLATQLDLADGAKIPGTDTARRLQALVANGWSMTKLGHHLGVIPGVLNAVVNGHRPGVTVATAKAVHQLYLELADQPPPEDTRQDRVAASRARSLARQRGWTPPLRIAGRLVTGTAVSLPAPDDDHDAEHTDYDEAAVVRRLDGDRTAALTKADRFEIVARTRGRGWSLQQITTVTGIGKPERYLTDATRRAS